MIRAATTPDPRHRTPVLADVQRAAERIAPHVHRTPVLTCSTFDQRVGATLFFKCEGFQKGGAFKFRGATNAVLSLADEEAARGVLTHSSGNHGAAVALAAAARGVAATVVMPRDSPRAKLDAVAGYGARVELCEPTAAAREETAQRLLAETGATFIHPFDDARVIAGQGTAALELLGEVADLDVLLVPVGGGGLASGTCLAAAGVSPRTRVVAAEPRAVDDVARSLAAGKRLTNPPGPAHTVADGLKTSLSELTYSILAPHLERVVTVSEEAIVAAMRLVWERMKIVVEPSAAVPVAALLGGEVTAGWDGSRPPRIGVVLSGANLDLDRLPWQAEAPEDDA